MTLENTLRQVETARAELAKAVGNAGGWSDQQRRTFDSQRVGPLDTAGARLLDALRKAQERCARAERLLGDR